MGRKRTPGLYKRSGFWYIDKQVGGIRLSESTGSSELEEAERYLAHRIEGIRQATVYGVRTKRTFREAATKYLLENQHKSSIGDDAMHLKHLDSFIGNLHLEQIHNGTLQPFILARQEQGRKVKTINLSLGVVRHILNLAATEWLDEYGLTWLHSPPKIKLLPLIDVRSPYPLSWEEQDKLFNQLPRHLHNMALFKVNTGCREQEVCQLRWEWEIPIPELRTSVFLIPREFIKNREDRLVILNDIAKEVIKQLRGNNSKWVFTYHGNPVTGMNNSAWKRARKEAGLMQVRVHDLKHTYGRRLRAAGVNFEDRQDLLGHKSARITTHYSSAEIQKLYEAANLVCSRSEQGLVVTLLKRMNSDMNNTTTRFRRNPTNTCEIKEYAESAIT